MTSALLAVALGALQVGQPAPDEACPDGRIVRVVVDNASIFDDSDPARDRRFDWAYTAANALHVRTRSSVVSQEVLFEPNDCYDQLLIDESARLLRALPFLSTASISPSRRGDGDWDVIVETRDAWSTLFDVAMRFDNGIEFEGASVAESNLLGTGHGVGIFYFERDVTQSYGVWLFTPQLARTRLDFGTAFGRTRAGTFTRHDLSYPFLGEPGRWAARMSYVREDRLFDYIMADRPRLDADHLLIPLREKEINWAVLRRLGRTGSAVLVGAGLTSERFAYTDVPQFAPSGVYDQRSDADPETAGIAEGQLENIETVRVSALLGHRNVEWVQRRGYDSMRGLQDIRLGSELSFEIGRSIAGLAEDDDLSTKLSLYAAVEAGAFLFALRGRVDARRRFDAPFGTDEWRDIYGDLELLAYARPGGDPIHTLVLRASGLGGWQTRTPFQFTLGGLGAVRGYDIERFPGGRRVIFSAEDRIFFGWPIANVLDMGATVFADAGQLWRGDAPFGVDSNWRASAGFGLRGAFPAGSPVTIRLDAAWPIERDTQLSDVRLRLSFGESFGLMRTAADYLFLRSRDDAVASGIGQFRN